MKKIICLLLFGSLMLGVNAQIITTSAGNGHIGFTGDGGPATSAEIEGPQAVATDGSGNVYLGDYSGTRLRKVNTSGIISTIAGDGVPSFSGDGGPATAAEIQGVYSIRADASGNIYFDDYVNHRIRKINTSGIITTVAGNGVAGYSGDGCPATAAEFGVHIGIAIDQYGGIYISDLDNSRIRYVDNSGYISTYAGTGVVGYSGDGGPCGSAEIGWPTYLTVDASSNIYFTQGVGSVVRKISNTRIITTVAGNGTGGFSGDGGPATSAEMYNPQGVAIDSYGNIYVSDDQNQRIRKINKSGIITTFAGNGAFGYNGDGGPATSAEISQPEELAIDPSSNLYIADFGNERVRKIPLVLTVSIITVTSIICNGNNNGSATASPSGGTTPYTYSWNPGGQTNATATGLSAGSYTVTVTDFIHASATASVTITQAGKLRDSVSTFTCVAHKVNATIGVKGGTPAYTYLWSPGGHTSATVTGLSNGVYTVTVTDKNGCTNTFSKGFLCHGLLTDNGDSLKPRCLAATKEVVIYPNPSKGQFNVFCMDVERADYFATIEIYNILGERVLEETLHNAQASNIINLSAQPSGVYFYRAIKEDGTFIGQGKIVVLK